MLASCDSRHSTVQPEAGVWSNSRTKTEKGKERRALKVRHRKYAVHTVPPEEGAYRSQNSGGWRGKNTGPASVRRSAAASSLLGYSQEKRLVVV